MKKAEVTDRTTPTKDRVRQRRRRSLFTLLGLVALLFFLFWYSLSYLNTDTVRVADPTPSPTCLSPDPNVLLPQDVTVNVYNASESKGLASKIAGDLELRGFGIGNVANDPEGKSIAGQGEIRYGKNGRKGALLLRKSLPGGVKVVTSSTTSTTVDLALGAKFTKLAPAPSATTLPLCSVGIQTIPTQ